MALYNRKDYVRKIYKGNVTIKYFNLFHAIQPNIRNKLF